MILECWTGFKTYSRPPLWLSTFPESALGTNLMLTEALQRAYTFGNEDSLLVSGQGNLPCKNSFCCKTNKIPLV